MPILPWPNLGQMHFEYVRNDLHARGEQCILNRPLDPLAAVPERNPWAQGATAAPACLVRVPSTWHAAPDTLPRRAVKYLSRCTALRSTRGNFLMGHCGEVEAVTGVAEREPQSIHLYLCPVSIQYSIPAGRDQISITVT